MNALVEQIKDIFVEHRANLPEVYRWEDEGERLKEFYFCLLRRISGKSEVQCRDMIACLSGLNLFELENLTEAQMAGGKGGKGDKLASLIIELLIHNNFADETAKAFTVAVCEMSKGLCNSYQGKLQKFLRKYANLMIDELDKIFSFSGLTKLDERYILVHWLQNTLEMPVPLSDEFVEKFCKKNGIKVDDLVEAADKINLNVAVLDDLLKLHEVEKL